jgi:predicted site-specific integrase-resolvase
MARSLARRWAKDRGGVSKYIRHLAYDWEDDYMDGIINTDDAESFIHRAKKELKELIKGEENKENRRLLKYELRFVRWLWEHYQDCCECQGCEEVL